MWLLCGVRVGVVFSANNFSPIVFYDHQIKNIVIIVQLRLCDFLKVVRIAGDHKFHDV
jgi:hypothetical protein